ncbi:DUF938 domain-containing protein [Pseudoruegeria sp. HB172150]|uniref:DUF938 domain-containing protein n=1 Tax=Pseudoruegeria sp. HB172150 TaxID=2721164 RepID=UPI001556B331|nr:DUF938 domain-containing protein [Pseudoruegeria sp. HB172150]
MTPTSSHTARFHAGNVTQAPDGRLFASAAERNLPPLIAALTPWMSGRVGRVLEIGCGTGQHAAAFRLAFPHLEWLASDPDAGHRASAAAWAAHLRLPEREVLDIDAVADWAGEVGPLSGVLSANVIHIAPFAVAEGIVAGAGKALVPGGVLVFYGPFRVAGRHIGEGNVRFDANLQAEDPEWGVRDTDEIGALAEAAGLSLAALVTMPANNRLVVFRK